MRGDVIVDVFTIRLGLSLGLGLTLGGKGQRLGLDPRLGQRVDIFKHMRDDVMVDIFTIRLGLGLGLVLTLG